MTFAEKLGRLRSGLGWNQADVARAAGVSQGAVSNWAKGKGKPDLDTGLKLARAFGVDLDYLADDAMDEPEPGLSEAEAELLRLARRIGVDNALDRILVTHEAVPVGETYGQRRRREGRDGSGDAG